MEFRLLYTPGPTQGRILEDANGTCSCTGFWAPYHSYGLPLCQQRRTQFSVELRRDGLARATESGVLRKTQRAYQSPAQVVFSSRSTVQCAKWTETSPVSFWRLTLYTTGDNWEQMTYGPRHGSSSFGFGPSESWYGRYTSTNSPGLNTGMGRNFAFWSACFCVRSDKLRRANSKANCNFPVWF